MPKIAQQEKKYDYNWISHVLIFIHLLSWFHSFSFYLLLLVSSAFVSLGYYLDHPFKFLFELQFLHNYPLYLPRFSIFSRLWSADPSLTNIQNAQLQHFNYATYTQNAGLGKRQVFHACIGYSDLYVGLLASAIIIES